MTYFIHYESTFYIMATDVKDDIASLIPKRDIAPSISSTSLDKDGLLENQAKKVARKANNDETRRLQRKAYSHLKHQGELNPDKQQEYDMCEVQELEERRKPALGGELAHLNGTTPAGVARLLKSLNINLDIQLTKNDTKNLLATLLTCNEFQLNALYANNKTPLAIKTVIKAIQVAAKDGNMSVVESLWNRIFGPTAFQIELPNQNTPQGIIPSGPVSREAYLMIRETLIGIKE